MGISVPNSGIFTLDDVWAAVNDHTPTAGDLVNCFANANPDFFDLAYNTDGYAPANSMLRFRNYQPVTINPPSYGGTAGGYNITNQGEVPYYVNYTLDFLAGGFGFGFNYVGSPWKTLVITGMSGNENNLYTIRNGGVPLSSFPINIDIENYVQYQLTPIDFIYDDPDSLAWFSPQSISLTFKIIDINGLSGPERITSFTVENTL